MKIPENALLLRVFCGESDRFRHTPFYEALVLKARESHLAGATVLRGPMGFGHSSRLHTDRLLRLSGDLSFVVEVVDSRDKIEAFLPTLDEMINESESSVLVTWEEIKVLRYGKGPVS